MPGDGDFNKRGPVNDYKQSISYRMVIEDIEAGHLDRALRFVRGIASGQEVASNNLNMMDVLFQAYSQGDHSSNLVTKFRETTELVFKELADKGLIHSGGTRNVESIEVGREDEEDEQAEEGEEWKRG